MKEGILRVGLSRDYASQRTTPLATSTYLWPLRDSQLSSQFCRVASSPVHQISRVGRVDSVTAFIRSSAWNPRFGLAVEVFQISLYNVTIILRVNSIFRCPVCFVIVNGFIRVESKRRRVRALFSLR
jgi:hypothetical protein